MWNSRALGLSNSCQASSIANRRGWQPGWHIGWHIGLLDKPKKGGTEGGHVDPPEIFAPSPVGTDRSRKMMQVAPTDAPKS